jgi:hypothetical protein
MWLLNDLMYITSAFRRHMNYQKTNPEDNRKEEGPVDAAVRKQ